VGSVELLNINPIKYLICFSLIKSCQFTVCLHKSYQVLIAPDQATLVSLQCSMITLTGPVKLSLVSLLYNYIRFYQVYDCSSPIKSCLFSVRLHQFYQVYDCYCLFTVKYDYINSIKYMIAIVCLL